MTACSIGKKRSPATCILSRIKKTRHYTNVNYEPRDVLCRPGCVLGKTGQSCRLYEFLKEALIRKFGAAL
jgi:hypothetical protein